MKENNASSTAYTVLQGILHTAQKPRYRHLVSSEMEKTCRQILESSDEGRKRLEKLDKPHLRFILPTMEWMLMPGITLHYVLRKRYIEDTVLKAIADGTTQVINIGAGFDTLAWRLQKQHTHVNFIEIDHPATSKIKTKALHELEDSLPNMHFLAVDLGEESLENVLGNFSGFEPERETLFICEGVLMYLKEEDVIRLLEALKKLTQHKVHLVFCCVEPMESEKNNIRTLLKWYLKSKNETMNWYMKEEALPSFLAEHGYTLTDLANSTTFKSLYLRTQQHGTLHQGEYFGVAQIG